MAMHDGLLSDLAESASGPNYFYDTDYNKKKWSMVYEFFIIILVAPNKFLKITAAPPSNLQQPKKSLLKKTNYVNQKAIVHSF